MTRWRRSGPGMVPALVMVLVLLAGCSGLPTHGPVREGLENRAANFQPIRLQFEAPPPGATPSQIVQGFLAAGWSPDDDYAAARAYLTGSASDAWRPRTEITVYTDPARVAIDLVGRAVRISVPVTGRVDASGRYVAASPGEVVAATVELAKVGGEWRISRLPSGFGVWLSRFYFERAYRQLTLTYVDPFDRTVVSDYRWFPLGNGLATTLARAQLEPVPQYLRGAAVTGFQAGADLAVDSVPIADRAAQIELTPAMLAASTDQRRAAWAQMLTTMRQVPGVDTVALSVDGAPLQILGQPSSPTKLSDLGFTQTAVAPPAIVQREGNRLNAFDFSGWIRGGENQRAVQESLPDVPKGWESIAVARGLRQVAAVSHDRATLFRWTSQGAGSPAPFGSSFTEPAFDQRGRTWIAGVDTRGRPRVWWVRSGSQPSTTPIPVDSSWILGSVVAARPSPGGRRMAVAVKDSSGMTSVYVAGITTGQEGDPVALGKPWRIAAGLTDLRDLAWADDASLAVLASMDKHGVRPLILPLGGPVEPLAAVRDASHIVTSGGVRGVIVVTSSGHVWRRVGTAWQDHGEVEELIVPGS